MAAIGDVIAASCVAKKLHDSGYDVSWITHKACSEAVENLPFISKFSHSKTAIPDIDLDEAYEKRPDRKAVTMHRIFMETLYEQMRIKEQRISETYYNLTPVLEVSEKRKSHAEAILRKYPKPWVLVCPKSNSFACRTVPAEIWSRAAQEGVGTWFWTGTDPSPLRIMDLKCRTIRELMAFLSCADMVATVESGPMHITAGLGKPFVVVKQSFDPAFHQTDQRDFSIISAKLDCLNCHKHKCPIDEVNPPCQQVPHELIAQAVKTKLESYNGDKISAVIPVYKPDMARLNYCIKQIYDQVDEIVVSIDGDGEIPRGLIPTPKSVFVRNPFKTRLGFGKTVNRAMRQSSGRYILLLNDDVYMKPFSVAHLKSSMKPGVAVVGSLLRYKDGTIQHGGCYRQGKGFTWGHIDHKQTTPTIRNETELEGVTFASALIRREAFYDVLGFDERFDCYGEDQDMCMSLRKRKWKIMYNPKAEGVHEESMTTSGMKQELASKAAKLLEEKWRAK